jgi:putative inorganic carbon (hco3(-)) transporter
MGENSNTQGVFTWLPFGGLLVLVLWVPIPYGSNVPWAVSLLGAAVFALLGIWALLLLAKRVEVPRTLWANRWVLMMWSAWLAWIGWQLLPIQNGPISIMPESTFEQLLVSITYFGLYLLVLLTAGSRDRLRILGMTIVLSGLVQAMYGSLMVLSGLEYGFLAKKTTQLGWATGTYINRNHLAGYLGICAAMGIGLVIADLRSGGGGNWRVWLHEFTELVFSRKLRIRIFLAIMVVALVLTQSRMGNIAFFTSLLLCGSIYVLLRERRMFLKAIVLFASFLVVDLLIVSEWFGLEKVVERIEQTNVETERRAHVFPELMRGIEAYRKTGSGLGTFSLAILPYRQVVPTQFYDHAHNDYAQFLIEVGIPGVVILGCLVLITALHAIRVIVGRRNRLRTGTAFGVLMALTFIAIHSAVDFNLQIPANAATLVIMMGMVNACSHQSGRSKRSQEKQ